MAVRQGRAATDPKAEGRSRVAASSAMTKTDPPAGLAPQPRFVMQMSDDGLVALGLVGVPEGMLTAARARTSHYRRRGTPSINRHLHNEPGLSC
ncbi:hypothetical protein GCM10010532_113810 [Dactylosporangium siamense]|uniref:Uncharacterized protein n=1 Tax=Dactylosporangium siamense TaxID=685454 RepID=A0A919PTH2_9ACTN|nr:hypothetical protein Dsi01nite_079200 [Dactylosporangium siamense]